MGYVIRSQETIEVPIEFSLRDQREPNNESFSVWAALILS